MNASRTALIIPPIITPIFNLILAGAVGEGLFALWLLVKGVDTERWIARANGAEVSLRR